MNNCFNCNATDSIGNPVETHMIEGKWVPLCDECMAEEERLESQANQLSQMASCEYRQMLIDMAQTTRELVNSVRAHDQSGCVRCVPKIAPASERGAAGQQQEVVA